MPSAAWWARALSAATAVSLVTLYLGTRFDIRIDPQVQRCIPGARAFLVDRHDREPELGDLVAFRPPNLEPLFDRDVEFVKRVVGMPGDPVVVSQDTTTVAGQIVARGLDAADAIGVAPKRFERRVSVPDENFWVVAPGAESIDSRYWGPLDSSRVIGTAYEIF